MYESFYIVLKIVLEDSECHLMDCGSKFLILKTRDLFKDFKDLKDSFDFSKWDASQDLFVVKIEEVSIIHKTETSKRFWIDEICFLGAKSHLRLCFNFKEIESKMKGIAKSSRDEYQLKEDYTCSMDRREFLKFVENYLNIYEDLEMYSGKFNKKAFNLFDAARKHITGIESILRR